MEITIGIISFIVAGIALGAVFLPTDYISRKLRIIIFYLILVATFISAGFIYDLLKLNETHTPIIKMELSKLITEGLNICNKYENKQPTSDLLVETDRWRQEVEKTLKKFNLEFAIPNFRSVRNTGNEKMMQMGDKYFQYLNDIPLQTKVLQQTEDGIK